MTTQQLTADQFVTGHIDGATLVDKYGNPTSVQGDWVWSSSDDTVASVDAPSPGSDFTITAVGPVGVAVVSGTADADLGDGVVPITAMVAINVVGGMASTVEVTLDAPQNKS